MRVHMVVEVYDAQGAMQRTALAIILVVMAALPCHALVSTNVPLRHWSYDAVEKLADYGLIDSAMLTIRPISRVEMARHIAQAMYALEGTADAPAILGEILARLREEFRGELILIGAVEGWHGGSFVKPVEDPYLRYVYADEATGLENERGDTFDGGSNIRLGFAARGKLWERAAFYVQPEVVDSSEEDGDVELVRSYGKGRIGPIEIEAGKDSLWWGPGRHGSIVMSNNVEPFTMLKITNPQPMQLPWILRYLGPFRGQWFLTELEDDRHIPEAKLSGIRLNARPHPLVELGASRVVMLGGKGAPDVDLVDYVEAFLALTEEEENNQLAGLDASLLLPVGRWRWGRALPFRALRFYVEGAGEDEAGGLPSNWGALYGLRISDILKTGRTDLRIEYADNHVAGKPNVFYSHSVYRTGYRYEGRIIGHHMGTDSRDLFLHLSHYLTSDLILDMAYNRQTHNLSADIQPTTNIYELGLTLFPSAHWQVEGGYRYEESDAGGRADNHVLQMGLVRRF